MGGMKTIPLDPMFTPVIPSKQTVPDAQVQDLFDRAGQTTPRSADPAAIPKGPDFGGQTGAAPTGGSLRDPEYVRRLVGYYSTQPGSNPSLKNDPEYWVRTLTTSPEWATANQDYAVSKFMQPEGAPSGGGLYPGSTAQGYPGNQFSDPSTQQYENLLKEAIGRLQQPVNDPNQAALADLLKQQTAYLQQQQQAQIVANEKLKAQQAQAQTSMGKYVDYANQRATELQGPAYTPSEQNILKTAATDPIEADRQASLKRALQNIGSRGFDPSSGIAQELMLQVNNAADQGRSKAQNALSVQQINEQRSRQQEAQTLLGAIPQAQMAAANGDLSFLQSLNDSVNKLGASAATSATQATALSQSARDQASAQENELLSRAGQLYQLPMNAAQGAMSALGQAPNPADMTQQSIQLAQLAQQKQAANANFWLNFGTSFFPLLGK